MHSFRVSPKFYDGFHGLNHYILGLNHQSVSVDMK